jgi:stress-induced morphogen
MKLEQLNFRVPAPLAERVRNEARRNRKTLDSVGFIIVSKFFKGRTKTQRDRLYKLAAPKISGRKIGS